LELHQSKSGHSISLLKSEPASLLLRLVKEHKQQQQIDGVVEHDYHAQMFFNRVKAACFIVLILLVLTVVASAAARKKKSHKHLSEQEQQCRHARHPIFIVPGESVPSRLRFEVVACQAG
jgi:hypothetical protein